MDLSRRFAAPGQNRLLSALSGDLQNSLLAGSERLNIRTRQVLYEPGSRMAHAYFPLSAVMSLAVPMKSGSSVEVATIGNEGVVGVPVFLGAELSPYRICSQIAGQAVRMRVDAFRRAAEERRELGTLVRRYSQRLFDQIAQTTACNRVHSVRQRLCRGLLTTQDRAGSDEFRLTQELLGYMLGVRRPGITVVANTLQKEGVIRYRRGQMRVTDRAGLAAAACECYEAIRQQLAPGLASVMNP